MIPLVKQFILDADVPQLQQMKTDLQREIDKGLLAGPSYTEELEFINHHLKHKSHETKHS